MCEGIVMMASVCSQCNDKIQIWWRQPSRDAKFCVSRARNGFIDNKLLQACIAMSWSWDAKSCVSTGLTPLRILGMYHWLYALFIKVETQNFASHEQGTDLLTTNYYRRVLLWVGRETQGMHLLTANYCRHVLLWVDRETQNFASLLWMVHVK